jgi:tRNA modification GTPase
MKTFTQPAGDTIVALSTPRGYSGIGVIRLSGPDAVEILRKVFRAEGAQSELPDRVAVYGKLIDVQTGKVLDDGLALVMKGPRSFTGEDVVELNLHGSPMVLDMVIHMIVRHGARLATRGEFTKRAFLSGKLDMLQAEAVVDLIEAGSPAAVHEARARLDASLSREIRHISNMIKDLLATLEAYIDFDEEDDMNPPEPTDALGEILDKINLLKRDAESARACREGLSTVIVGKPNVGKSTLFNALMKADRAIVTPFPGTTRDPVDDYIILGELSFVLCDTAGIRNNPDPIEEEGIRRTRERINNADIVIAVLDGSAPLDEEDSVVLDACREKPAVVAVNKMDLVPKDESPSWRPGSADQPSVRISAKTGQGLTKLRDLLTSMGENTAMLGALPSHGSLNLRGLLLMETAGLPIEGMLETLRSGKEITPEIVALELRRALGPLEEVTGERVDEGVLDRIFERFCIGK